MKEDTDDVAGGGDGDCDDDQEQADDDRENNDDRFWMLDGETRKNKVVMSPLVVLLTTHEKDYCK